MHLWFFWDTREHKKGHFEVQAWISIDFWWILLPMVVIWLLGASTLASWGALGRSWDDPGTLEGTRKDPARSRLGFYRFFIDFGDPFCELFGYFWTKKKQLFISISRLLFLLVFGSKLGCLGLENMHLAWEVLQKSTSVEIGFLMIPGSIFHDFG